MRCPSISLLELPSAILSFRSRCNIGGLGGAFRSHTTNGEMSAVRSHPPSSRVAGPSQPGHGTAPTRQLEPTVATTIAAACVSGIPGLGHGQDHHQGADPWLLKLLYCSRPAALYRSEE